MKKNNSEWTSNLDQLAAKEAREEKMRQPYDSVVRGKKARVLKNHDGRVMAVGKEKIVESRMNPGKIIIKVGEVKVGEIVNGEKVYIR